MPHRLHKCTNNRYDCAIITYVSLMYELKKMERYLRVNLLGPGPRLMKKNLPGHGLTKVEKHCNTGYSLVHVNRNKYIATDISEEIQCQLPLHTRMWDVMGFFLYLLNSLAPYFKLLHISSIRTWVKLGPSH